MEIEALKAAEDDLRSKIALLEKKLEEALNREKILEKEIVDWEGKYSDLNKEMQKLRDEIEVIRRDAEKEVQKWKTEAYTAQTELKNLQAANETLRSQLAAANERANSLNRTISEQAAKMRECMWKYTLKLTYTLSSHIHRLEEQLTEAKATAAAFEADLHSTQSRLEAIEQQYTALQLENNKLRTEIDALHRQIDVLKNTNATNESEIDRLKKKVAQLITINKEQTDELTKLRAERDHLDRAYHEKANQVEQLKELVKTLETKVNRMHQEVAAANEKFQLGVIIKLQLVAAENEQIRLRSEVTKLEKELQLVRDQLKRKTDDFNAALEDLANAHRVSEDARVNALQELESRKFEISDLKSRLDNTEQRLATLQQEYLNVDKECETLRDSLYRFQSIISRSVIPEGGK
ncbi:unnamed protein product [Toxocara canis]|uniref:Myosin_tail_1 domain-containing protein n=1 Tax=Toxocara canis TaxID=6265 RepID=A0A183U2N0_TOXCA|nr:unnamed protein product [Toxocara canis]